MSPDVTEEIIARQPPEAQAIIRLLLARIAELEARIEELQRQGEGKRPANNSPPPRTPEPLRHQVWELPEIKPHVTEYQLHRLGCARCGETTCAELPIGVPRGQSGPRLMSF